MLRYILTFLLYSTTFMNFHCSCSLIEPKLIENYEENLGKLAASVFLNDCRNCRTAYVIYMEEDNVVNNFFNEVAQSRNYGTGIYTIKLSNFTAEQLNAPADYVPDITVIFLNKENVEEVIFNIEIATYWFIRRKILVVASGEIEDIGWIEESFNIIWESEALRILLCFWQNGPKLFAYNPFLENYGFEVTNRSDLTTIFEHKIKNMNGYPIKIYNLDLVFKDRLVKVIQDGEEKLVGRDGKFFSTITKWLNASLIIHPVSEDFSQDMVNTGHNEGRMKDSVRILADMYDFDLMANTGRVYADNELDHVFLYDRNDMVIIVPRGKLIPRYLYIFLIVPLNVWCCTLSSLMIISIFMICLRRYNHKKIDIVAAFINNYRLLLNGSIPNIGQNNQERFLTIVWISHCIIIATLFQSVLTTTLIAPKYYPDINTLQDLYKTDLKVYAAHYTLVHLTRELAEENKRFLDHLVEIPIEITSYGENIDWIELYRYTHGVMVSTEQVHYLKFNSKNVLRPNFHVMSESIMPNVQAYNIRNEKLFYEEFLQGMGVIEQAGLYNHWRKYNYDFDVKTIYNTTDVKMENDDGIDSENRSLTMEHLQAAFLLMMFGECLATIVFFCELIFRNVKCLGKRN